MSDRDEQLMTTCWRVEELGAANFRRCHTRVPKDPEHVGLCDRHLEELREAA